MGEVAKPRRPSLSRALENELWARAAGRCEFRGCNKLLYKDDLTQAKSNLGIISHIVACRPAGPRGDATRSKALEKDIRNLMLTCRKHGKLIDDCDKVSEYPEELLVEFKREHERRVRMLTESKEDAQTHVVILQAPIDGRDVHINPIDAFRAILPKYPDDEEGTLIDLSGTATDADTPGFFPMMASVVEKKTRPLLERRAGRSRYNSLSVFALAPVPLLVHLGYLLGDIGTVDLHQRHRGGQDWAWPEVEEMAEFYEVSSPEVTEGEEDHRKLALLLSLSVRVARTRVRAALAEEPHYYEIRADVPGKDFLRSRTRLEVLGYEMRKLLDQIRDTHGHDRPVHVFAAVPSPAAIEFGRNIKAFDPPFEIYEYQKADRSYVRALTVNPHRGSKS
jgi:hypothetical protein